MNFPKALPKELQLSWETSNLVMLVNGDISMTQEEIDHSLRFVVREVSKHSPNGYVLINDNSLDELPF